MTVSITLADTGGFADGLVKDTEGVETGTDKRVDLV